MRPLMQISQSPLSAESIEEADFSRDDDPLDEISDYAPALGILVRTDYTNESAWQAFYSRLQDAEAEFASAATADLPEENVTGAGGGPSAAHGAASLSTDAEGDSAMDDEGEDGEKSDDGEGTACPVFFVVNATSLEERAKLAGISNLTALRLLNDVDVRRAPAPPTGTKRIRPPNRLVDHDGWQEVYNGKTVWVYDDKSNQDQCVRLVSQKGAAMYGTATSVHDSPSHLPRGTVLSDDHGTRVLDVLSNVRPRRAAATVGAHGSATSANCK